MPAEALTIRALRARAVSLPMNRPIYTGGGSVTKFPMVLVDLETEEGICGCSYIFCYAPFVMLPLVQLLENLGEIHCWRSRLSRSPWKKSSTERSGCSARRVLRLWPRPGSTWRSGMSAPRR